MSQLGAKGSKIPYLDGLRAYSILLVLIGHSVWANSWIQTKWYLQLVLADSSLGVRIFFVLSGFLITTLLLNEQDASGRISIRGFYERRIARIFPAFYLYIATVVVFTAFHAITVPTRSIFAAMTFTSNFAHFWHAPVAPDHNVVLGHFWTLSLEEQFYVIWPSVLVFTGRRWALRLAVACVVLFPFLRMAEYEFLLHHPELTNLRFAILVRSAQDMIMWGVLGAFAIRNGLLTRMRTHRFRWTYPWISGLMAFGVAGVTLAHPFLGFDTSVLPTFQAVAALLFIFWLLSGDGGLLRRGLESWPVVELGLLSYSLYIWQQPFTEPPGIRGILFPWTILASLAVAIVSYRVVELPMRKLIRKWFSQPRLQEDHKVDGKATTEMQTP